MFQGNDFLMQKLAKIGEEDDHIYEMVERPNGGNFFIVQCFQLEEESEIQETSW